MVSHDHWYRACWEAMMAWCMHHRILLYIAFVVTVTLIVQVFHIDFVGD